MERGEVGVVAQLPGLIEPAGDRPLERRERPVSFAQPGVRAGDAESHRLGQSVERLRSREGGDRLAEATQAVERDAEASPGPGVRRAGLDQQLVAGRRFGEAAGGEVGVRLFDRGDGGGGQAANQHCRGGERRLELHHGRLLRCRRTPGYRKIAAERTADGLTPNSARKVLVKWLWLLKPRSWARPERSPPRPLSIRSAAWSRRRRVR